MAGTWPINCRAIPAAQDSSKVATVADELRRYCQDHIDPVAIDRNAEIPQERHRRPGQAGRARGVPAGLVGGQGLSQTAYCRLIEVLGGHCASTALFVNAHHSIGPRAIVLFGTPEQQAKWLPKLATGEWISAFALTEPEAGSDAANVQTTATPTPDGSGYVLNGQKRWITNGGIAQVLTVMARTPVPGSAETKITAFLVTPDMPGFEVVEARMAKCGVRGTATARLAFHDMFVPQRKHPRPARQGLEGRADGARLRPHHVRRQLHRRGQVLPAARGRSTPTTRVQFGQTLGSFELVKEKLAYMHAGVFAMEAATYQTAALIDSGDDDYMLETAMLKVFSTDVLWRIINDTIQIYGGKAYFTDEPYERMMRDARINMIGEGANDVLRAFIALVGMRDVGLELKGILDALMSPWSNLGKLIGFAGGRLEAAFSKPEVRVTSSELADDASRLGALIGSFSSHVERLLRTHREAIVDRQYQLGRIGDASIELYVSSCVLSRMDRLLEQSHGHNGQAAGEMIAARYYLKSAARRIRHHLAELSDNDDADTTATADALLKFAAGGKDTGGY